MKELSNWNFDVISVLSHLKSCAIYATFRSMKLVNARNFKSFALFSPTNNNTNPSSPFSSQKVEYYSTNLPWNMPNYWSFFLYRYSYSVLRISHFVHDEQAFTHDEFPHFFIDMLDTSNTRYIQWTECRHFNHSCSHRTNVVSGEIKPCQNCWPLQPCVQILSPTISISTFWMSRLHGSEPG